MPKGKRGKRRKSEKVVVGITVLVDRAIYPTGRVSIAEQARREFLETGEEMEGVKIIGRWKNPNNKNPRHSNWKTSEDDGQSLGGFHKTIIQRIGIGARNLPLFPTEPEERAKVERTREQRSTAAKLGHVTREVERGRAERLEATRKRSTAALKGAATKAKTKANAKKPAR